MRLGAIVAAFVLAAMFAADSVAQSPPPAAQQPDQHPPKGTGPVSKQLQTPSPEALLVMIRSTLIALHHGNVTGNYTVLRDLSAPGFQAANSAASLGQIFANLRSQHIDLAPALLLTPELVQGPATLENGMLSMTGFFATQPLRINFQLTFQAVNGFWRPFGIGINPTAAPEASAAPITSNSTTPAKASPAAANQPNKLQPAVKQK